MKIVKKRGSNFVKLIANERTFERKIKSFEKLAPVEIKKKLKKRKGKKVIGVLATYRWGSLHQDAQRKPKVYSKIFDDKTEAEKIYNSGDIKTLSGNKRLKGEKYTWKIETDRKTGKHKVLAFRHLQKGESYFNGFKFPALAPLTEKNILNTIIADITEKYEFYAYEKGYDKPYKLRDITLTFVYE